MIPSIIDVRVSKGSPDIPLTILKISAKSVDFALFYDLSKLGRKISKIAILKKSYLKNQDMYGPRVFAKSLRIFSTITHFKMNKIEGGRFFACTQLPPSLRRPYLK